jgi:hypothetical protein
MPNLVNSKFYTKGFTITSTSTGASGDVLYTCPNNYSAIIRYLHLSNNNTSNKNVSLEFYHADDTSYHFICKDFQMSGYSIQNFVDAAYFNLHQGDKIIGSSETASTMEVMLSLEEYYNPLRG